MLIRETHKIQTAPGTYGFLAGAFVLLLGLLANVSCAHASKLDGLFVRIQERYDSAVEISVHCAQDDGQTSTWAGSGVIVSESRILTAGHVVETKPGETCAFAIEDSAGKVRLARPMVVMNSDEIDLASMELLLTSERFSAPPVKFGAPPKPGEPVCAATGYPRREYKCGETMIPKKLPGDIRMYIVVEHGNSGSALYNVRGELVGIVVHTYMNYSNGQYVSGGATSLEGRVNELLP